MDFQTVIASSNGTDDGGKSPSGPSSFSAVAAAFVPTFVTASLFVSAFVIIRPKFPKIYFPRTYLGTIPKKDHTPCQSHSYWDWVHTMRVVPDKFTLYHQSIDSYLFLRFLRTMIFICVVGCVLTWPILMPINAAGGGTGSELDRVSIGNVAEERYLYAHAIIAWVFFGFVMFTVARERLWLIGLRQAWNLSKPIANRLSSRTVLFLSAPTAALDESNMRRFFGDDAVKVWPVAKAEKLQSLISSRDAKIDELEIAEISLIQKANEEGRRGQKRNHGQRITYGSLPDSVKQSLRPTQRLKTTKPVGKQVDGIDWARDQLLEKEEEIQKARESNESATSQHGAAAVFVQFRTQSAAQAAYQQVVSSDVLSLTPRFIGVLPSEVFWNNLTIEPARRISQGILAHALVIALIIFWSIPVAFVGAVSNVTYLAENFKFLSFLNHLPDSVINLLTGLVPPLLLSALNIFTTFGEPTKTSTELKVLKWYYVFQVLQVFLITSLSSGAATVVSQIVKNPNKIPEQLAERLPRASNSYLTYFVVQGLTSASDNLLNYSDVLSFVFFDKFFDKTPRQKYNSYIALKGMQWGKLFPKYVNFVIIAIVYSCIAPLVLGFAAAGLVLFYLSYRYMLLFTAQPKVDTKGHCYTLALQQMLTGVYIAELCLIGLFSLRGAFGPTILLGILFIATVIFNILTNRYFAPLEQYLPADLALDGSSDEDDEEAPLLSSAEQGQSDAIQREETRIQRISSTMRVSPKVTGPLARFFEPHIFASHLAMKRWIQDGDFDKDYIPEYSDEDIRKAYLNPAYTSQTPVVWLAKDDMGVSQREIQENEKKEIKCSDEGAWIDKEGNLKWSVDDFEKVPIFKKTKQW
ncbi:membrane protein [Ascochyta rabiei]|uniref:Membrane protein n=1 Tax=Didymella rabiei TaxID=5454 RepID=A0A162XKV9_DIDRA|nr:membrane protein [Ascochyta rabiei]